MVFLEKARIYSFAFIKSYADRVGRLRLILEKKQLVEQLVTQMIIRD